MFSADAFFGHYRAWLAASLTGVNAKCRDAECLGRGFTWQDGSEFSLAASGAQEIWMEGIYDRAWSYRVEFDRLRSFSSYENSRVQTFCQADCRPSKQNSTVSKNKSSFEKLSFETQSRYFACLCNLDPGLYLSLKSIARQKLN